MKRNDAKLVYDIPLYNRIFPYLMKRRCDALVYHKLQLDVTKTLEYIRKYNATKPEFRLKFFYVFCAALMRMFAMRPELNRFIARYHYWQRNELSMNFVVKEKFTEEAPETSSPLVFRPDMTLFEYAKVIEQYINDARNVSEQSNFTDDTIGLLMHFPTWLIALAVKVLGSMDRRGFAPGFLKEADGLHTSVFVSNLGSIGIAGGSPMHHLYEWGTTSIFITIGAMERKREFDDDGKVISCKETVEIGATVDERITSGFYFVKSMHYLQYLLDHPEELEQVPQLPAPIPTKKEYKQMMRQQKLLKKKQRKAQKSES